MKLPLFFYRNEPMPENCFRGFREYCRWLKHRELPIPRATRVPGSGSIFRSWLQIWQVAESGFYAVDFEF